MHTQGNGRVVAIYGCAYSDIQHLMRFRDGMISFCDDKELTSAFDTANLSFRRSGAGDRVCPDALTGQMTQPTDPGGAWRRNKFWHAGNEARSHVKIAMTRPRYIDL
ncbi:hypothetical protein GGD67_002955 [Bradyrhizobium sp. IAR9]|uniref:hypothetical protein n=1 Tax=Bradyrhizobium sp. IAR9 TaxID=2663841 RepID=UPI0015C6A91A|nr:hypothetical protein [Bradyrhizobium sp. IAR9]NYG45497.1 hypothetical protein [Bradyrhizobium sp. IAR9]